MPGKWIPDHQKDNVQLNLLSSYIQLYILSGESSSTHMQDLMLQTKCRAQIFKKGYNICVFTPSPTAQDDNESSKKLCEGNLIILKRYWNFFTHFF